MRRFILTAGVVLAVASAGTPAATATTNPTRATTATTAISKHVRTYLRLYNRVAHKFGARTPGRNIVVWGFSASQASTDREVVRSIGVLRRMLAPPARYTPSALTYTGTTVYTTQTSYSSAPVTYSAPAGGLEACIIQHESGGNPQATNGQYAGIGQWSPSSWQTYSHGKYGASPLDASYAQQEQVLASEGAAGMESQQGQYDGC